MIRRIAFICFVVIASAWTFPANAASNDVGPWKYHSEKTGFGKSIYYQTTTKVGSETHIFTVACLDTGESSHSIVVYNAEGMVYWPKVNQTGLIKIGTGKITKITFASYASQKGITFYKSPTLGVLTGLRGHSTLTYKASSFEGDPYQATFKVSGVDTIYRALKANGCKK